MKRMGQPFETAYCKHCRQVIHHIWWGNGGTIWQHAITGRVPCGMPRNASPDPETIAAKGDQS